MEMWRDPLLLDRVADIYTHHRIHIMQIPAHTAPDIFHLNDVIQKDFPF